MVEGPRRGVVGEPLLFPCAPVLKGSRLFRSGALESLAIERACRAVLEMSPMRSAHGGRFSRFRLEFAFNHDIIERHCRHPPAEHEVSVFAGV
jgi:hypothetical protein